LTKYVKAEKTGKKECVNFFSSDVKTVRLNDRVLCERNGAAACPAASAATPARPLPNRAADSNGHPANGDDWQYRTTALSRDRFELSVAGLPDGIGILKPKIPIWVNSGGP
jgi:hypothetical protein